MVTLYFDECHHQSYQYTSNMLVSVGLRSVFTTLQSRLPSCPIRFVGKLTIICELSQQLADYCLYLSCCLSLWYPVSVSLCVLVNSCTLLSFMMELLKNSVAMQEQVLASKGFLVIGYTLEKVTSQNVRSCPCDVFPFSLTFVRRSS